MYCKLFDNFITETVVGIEILSTFAASKMTRSGLFV